MKGADKSTVSRTFEGFPFVLSESKLSRLSEVCRDAIMRTHPDCSVGVETVALMKNERVVKSDSIEDLLKLDNTQKSGIKGLKLKFFPQSKAEAEGEADDEAEGIASKRRRRLVSLNDILRASASIVVRFNYDGVDEDYFGPHKKNGIDIKVNSGSPGWAQEAIGAVEEQIERLNAGTLSAYVMRLKSLGAFSFAILSFVAALGLAVAALVTERQAKSDANRRDEAFRQMADSATTESEKLDLVIDILLREYASVPQDPVASFDIGLMPALVIGVGIAIMIVLVYLFLYCYPPAVFCWGDVADEYQSLKQRRSFWWNTVVVATILNVLTGILTNAIFPSTG